MNYALALLILILAMLILAFLILVGRMYYFAREESKPLIILPNQDTKCEPDFSTLVDASNYRTCTNPSEFLVGSRYVDPLNMIVSLVPTPFVNSCIPACQSGFNPSTSKCTDPTYQPAFDKCISLTIPKGCTSIANPVAYIGENYYYNNHYGVGRCFDT